MPTGRKGQVSVCAQVRQVRGNVLVICLIFLAVFSALAVSLSATASLNLESANNLVSAERALIAAESGLLAEGPIHTWYDLRRPIPA